MKSLVLIWILTVSFQCVYAQNTFAPVGARWHYTTPCSGNNPDCGYYLFEAVKDTVLLGKNSTILSYSINGQLIENAQQILNYDSGKVYYFMNNSFQLLYDFNAQAGDTLILKMGPSYFTSGDTAGFYKVIVDSIRFINISGVNLKTFFHHSLYDLTFEGAAWRYFGPVIERIGDLGLLFGHSVNFPTIDHLGWIRCYEDSSIYYNPSGIQCDYILGLNDNTRYDDLPFYPNPTNSVLHLQSNHAELKNEPYDLYNLFGARIGFGILNEPFLDISHLPNGVYILHVINKQFKFIKK